VVGVRHVTDPRGGRISTTTRALLVGGALALALGAVAFIAATRIAAGNAADLAAWLAKGKPQWAFRPDFVPAWLSVMSLVGLSGGLTALVAGLSRRKRDLEPSTVSIGSAAGVDFPVAGATKPSHALVAPLGDGFALDLTGMTGEIATAQGIQPIPAMAAPLPVTPGLTVRAKLGKAAFYIAATDAPRRQTTPLVAMLDRRAAMYLAASAAAHLALFAVARTAPPDALQGNVGLFDDEAVDYKVLATVNETTPPEPEDGEAGDTAEGGPNAMALEVGTIGREDQNSADPAKRKIMNRNSEALARKEALEAAASAGILGSMTAADTFQTLVGIGDVSSGFDDVDIIGGYDGTGDGAPNGFGQSHTGFGPGGGGWSFRVGGYNTFGDGKRFGDGYGTCKLTGCKGGPLRPDRVAAVPRIGKPSEVSPGYDKEIVRRYVHRKLAQISYCYDKQLLVSPDISGTVMAEWTIAPNGTVTGATANGVHAEVSSCIATVVSTIKFPKPPAIGIFKVRYPFTLRKPAG
jgi:hypothetical protein